jgi:hypothetical protein
MTMGDNAMLCTSNYVARKFGVWSAIRVSLPLTHVGSSLIELTSGPLGFIAKQLCSDLILINPNFHKLFRPV